MSNQFSFNFENEPVPCRIAEGWEEAGKNGYYFGCVEINKMYWAIVKWDEDEDPTLHKLSGIEVGKVVWGPIAKLVK